MWVKSSLILQTLLVGLKPGDSDVSGSSEDSLSSSAEQRQQLTPIPDPDDHPTMARFIVHNANWTSVAFISGQAGTAGLALADMFAVSDGPVEAGCGTPYFYVSRLQAAVTDLLDHNSSCSLTMGLQQTGFCKERDWDDEDPRCAHLILTGSFQVVNEDSLEYARAQKALFTRHPSFATLPLNHHFFVAKYDILTITLQDYFGGPVTVSVDDYYHVKQPRFNLQRLRRKPHTSKRTDPHLLWPTIDHNYIVVDN